MHPTAEGLLRPGGLPDQLEWLGAGDMFEVPIDGQEPQAMADTELGDQGVDRTHLNASPAAPVAKLGGPDVIFPIGDDQRQRAKSLDDVVDGDSAGRGVLRDDGTVAQSALRLGALQVVEGRMVFNLA